MNYYRLGHNYPRIITRKPTLNYAKRHKVRTKRSALYTNRFQCAGSGSIQLSGTSEAYYGFKSSGKGSISLSGTATLRPYYVYHGEGGIRLSGSINYSHVSDGYILSILGSALVVYVRPVIETSGIAPKVDKRLTKYYVSTESKAMVPNFLLKKLNGQTLEKYNLNKSLNINEQKLKNKNLKKDEDVIKAMVKEGLWKLRG